MAFLNEMMGFMDINHDIQPQNIHTEPNLVPPNLSNTTSNQAYNPYGGSGTNQNIGYQSNFNPAPAAQILISMVVRCKVKIWILMVVQCKVKI